jgi:hypothetical protein
MISGCDQEANDENNCSAEGGAVSAIVLALQPSRY